MKQYETMLITTATLGEEENKALIGKFKTLIEKNGTIEAVEEWGKRRLAYPINKENDGIYTLIHFQSNVDFPAELDRRYKITDGVLRNLIIAKTDEQLAVEEKNKAKAAKAVKAAQKAEEAKKEAEAAAKVEEAAKAQAAANAQALANTEEAKAEPAAKAKQEAE